MKKVIVPGGGGFIGSYIAEFLINDNLSRDKLLLRELSIIEKKNNLISLGNLY